MAGQVEAAAGSLYAGYDTGGFYEEVFAREPDGRLRTRAHYQPLIEQLDRLSARDLQTAGEMANLQFLTQGITFTVYSDNDQGTERIFPFDLIPRLIPAAEWRIIETGL